MKNSKEVWAWFALGNGTCIFAIKRFQQRMELG
jgi:hypothetical protein